MYYGFIRDTNKPTRRQIMKIQVSIKSVYGQEKIYPVCKNAKLFAELVGQKTLTRSDISKIKMLGYEVEVVQEVKSL